MTVLNDKQFADHVATYGGGSRFLSDNRAAPYMEPAAKNTYSVSRPGNEVKFNGDPTGAEWGAHKQSVVASAAAGKTAPLGPDDMQGGWKHEGRTYADRSQLVSGTNARTTAISLGRQRGEIGVEDMHNGVTLYPHKSGPQAPELKPGQRLRGSRRTGYRVKGTPA